MVYRSIITVFLFGLFFGQSNAQNNEKAIVKAFEEAISEVVVLKNEKNLIPLRRLDTLKIALIGFGLTAGCDLQRDLENYSNVKAMMPPGKNEAMGIADWLKAIRAEYNVFIIGINDYDYIGDSPVETSGQLIRSLLQLDNSIAVIFGQRSAFRAAPWIDEADAVISTPYNLYAHSLAAQVVMGGVGASGVLQEDLNDLHRKGSGIKTESIERLRFSPPEAVGMNRQLMEDSIKAIVKEGMDSMAYPGAQVVVVKSGHVIYHESFGYHTYDRFQKVTNKDLYDFASVTKTTSGLPALMKLYGEGKFDLDAPLSRYFPAFKNSNKGHLEFRQMLAHNARLLAWVPYWKGTLKGNATYPWKSNWDNARINDGKYKSRTLHTDSTNNFTVKLKKNLWLHKDFKTKRIYKSIKKSPLNEEGGYLYSGLLFYLLPEIVSDLVDEDFETYLKNTFYRKLGAYTITYNPYKHYPLSRIVPTENDTFFRMMQIHGQVHDEGAAMMDGVSCNAGLFATAIDLAKLYQMYMNGGSYGGEQLIAEKAVKEFTKCQYCDEGNRRGLGFEKPMIEYDAAQSSVAKDASPSTFGHTGYTGTFVFADPENELLFIFFSNRVYPTRDNRKVYTMNIRPRIHQALYDAMK